MRTISPARLARCVAVALLLSLVGAASASAAVQWSVTSVHGPQSFVPGQTGQYMIQAYNLGDTATTADYTITDTLPDGVSVTDASADWSCIGLPGPVVSCRHDGTSPPVQAPGASAFFRGAAPVLELTVAVDPSASGTGENRVTISGGGPGAVSASDVDPTSFGAAQPGFGFVANRFLADVFDSASADASPVRQAGAHPYELRVNFDMNLRLREDVDAGDFYTDVDQHFKTLETRLPRGVIGNPQAVPTCPAAQLNFGGPSNFGACPANTQVGSIDLVPQNGKTLAILDGTTDIPVYNMVPPSGAVAALGFQFNGIPIWILATVDPSDYSVVARLVYANEVFGIRSAHLSLWGVPGDPAHDALRLDPNASASTAFGASFSGPIKPFLTLPFQCGVDRSTRVSAESWENPGSFVSIASTPFQVTGCDDPRFRFKPTIQVRPESHDAGAPTGLDVTVSVPQKDDAVSAASQLYEQNGADVAIPTPPVRDASITLPPGMVVSPSGANGLAACGLAQIGLGTTDAPACPDASKIGSVTIDTPLLPDPLTGSVYLAAQSDNPFGSLLALYLVAQAPGVIVKLPGRISPDPVTGQLTASFADTPELPFSTLRVHLDGGPFAPLVNPDVCGTHTATGTLTSWNSHLPSVSASDSFTLDRSCTHGFDPGFKAGTTSRLAGRDASIVTRFTRGDADDELSTIDVSLPEGVLGRIAKVDLCTNAAGNAGTCGDGSRIGTAVVGAGPGSNPFYISDGRVYLTGPYKGAPFGLSIVVHAKAGPLDLGNVVVRAAVFVDRRTTALRIVTDRLPTILQGIPLQLRVVDVTVDREGFAFNPTSCAAMNSHATLGSTGGASATKTARFRVAGCSALSFAPRLTLAVGSRGRVTRGRSTPLTATLRMPAGGANLRGVSVSLPTTINARLGVINRACTLAQFEAGTCAKAKAGSAVAVTPLLRRPLRGGIFFVKRGRGLPHMMVALHGQVDVDLDSRITIPGSKHLATNFGSIPDVPVTLFKLRLVSGRHGPVGVAANLCRAANRRATATVRFTAQSGKRITRHQRLVVRGCGQHR